jgi:STE24 endopeptidase
MAIRIIRMLLGALLVGGLGIATCGAQETVAPTEAAPAAVTNEGAPPAVAAAPEIAAPPALMENALGPVPADNPRAEAYAHGAYVLFFVGVLWDLAVLLVIIVSGFGAWMQELAERVTRHVNLMVALYVTLFTVVTSLASFPLAVYSQFLREREYGFMNQSFGAWMWDQGKGLLLLLALQAIFLPMLYIVIRRVGRAWWIPGAILTVAFMVVLVAIVPVYIAPLFNHFTPLKDAALREDILDLAHSQGIPAHEVYEVDASRQSEHNNAYVAGLLGTQRVVLYDTLLKRFAPREIRFVMGHEMGHYVLNHVWKTVGFFSILIVVGFVLVDRMARRFIDRHSVYGILRFEDPSSLPVILMILTVFFFVTRPIISTFSRSQEHAADVFGLQVVGDPEAAASVFLKFGRYDLAEFDVDPRIEFFLYTHPSVGNRILFAQQWARTHPASPLSAPASAPPVTAPAQVPPAVPPSGS